MPRETFCSKCQGMVNGNGCDDEKCEVNEGKGYKAKLERDKRESAQTAKDNK